MRSYPFCRWKRNPLHFMKPEGLLPCLPTPTTCPCRARTVQPMPSHPICLRSILILSPYQFPCLPSGLMFSLPRSQEPVTCLYAELDQSTPFLCNPTSCRSMLILSSRLCFCLPSDLFLRLNLQNCIRSNSLRLFFPLIVTGKISHPYKTTGKFIVVNI